MSESHVHYAKNVPRLKTGRQEAFRTRSYRVTDTVAGSAQITLDEFVESGFVPERMARGKEAARAHFNTVRAAMLRSSARTTPLFNGRAPRVPLGGVS